MKQTAFQLLHGVGSVLSGQWEELTIIAFHLRRRLTEEEQELVGQVVDIRNTEEAITRLEAVKKWLPEGYKEW